MSSSSQTSHEAASVLVIASDANIESLLSELIAFAGYRPMQDPTMGAAGESIRRVRPDIVFLDTSLPHSVVRACYLASDEVGSRPVLFSSTTNSAELEQEARARGTPYFALPGGPRPLGAILDRALRTRPAWAVTAIPTRRRGACLDAAMDPALRAALASVARARALSLRAQSAVRPNLREGFATQTLPGEARRSHQALRAAVVDYTRQLKAADMPMDQVLSFVSDRIAECATVVGAEPAIPALLLEAEEWTREAYDAA